ncbi:hypothetical protein KI387_042574, partial [Taxus chinensis]
MINFTGGGITYQYFTDCGFSTILDPVTWVLPYNQGGLFTAKGHYGFRLDWSIGRSNCVTAKGTSSYSCAEQAECKDQTAGHVCKCLPGYKGNGYSNGTGCTSSVSSFIGVSLGACGLFWWLRRRRLKQERDNNFQLNGGIQLQQHIAAMGGRKTLRIFSEKELEIASNNYSSELGRGGFATVYKGVLLDGTQVAIKKPKAISPEFHNEVMIFSHINHRNTVKMLGCCLQTQFPLLTLAFLVYGLRMNPTSSTMAAGTPGYLDPEFITSDQYTDKSDVFSFGVVLVELLTGLKPLLSQEGIVHTLYDHFLSAIHHNRLTEILDSNVVNEENQAQMENMSRLAQACLQQKGRARPSMREVVEELAWIRAATKHSGLYTNVNLVEHRGDSTQAKMNGYTLAAVGESTSEDPYPWPGLSEIITSEDPSTSLIQTQLSD